MKSIKTDSVLFFTDIHIGLRSDSLIRLDVCRKVVDQIIETIKERDIKHVFFLGDLFHSRVSLNVNTINTALELIKSISKHAHLYMIIGNHDIHYKNSSDIHSIRLFEDQKNITVIDEPTELMINDKKMLLVPWMADLSKYEKESVDYLAGHFDISSKYLIASYIEDHLNKKDVNEIDSSKVLNELINHEIFVPGSGISNEASSDDINEIIASKNKSASAYIGSFIDICKKGGTVLAGHIHTRKEFKHKNRKFIFIGSPQQQNFGDRDGIHGYYVHSIEGNKFEFIETVNIPKHLELNISSITKVGINQFDFSICSNN